MTCHRCEGFMVQDDYFQLVESDRRLAAWRCVLCGDVVDPVIEANKKQQLAGVASPVDSPELDLPIRPLTRAA